LINKTVDELQKMLGCMHLV